MVFRNEYWTSTVPLAGRLIRTALPKSISAHNLCPGRFMCGNIPRYLAVGKAHLIRVEVAAGKVRADDAVVSEPTSLAPS